MYAMLCYAMDRGTDLLDGFGDHNDAAFERVSLRRWGNGLYLQLDLTLSVHETNRWIFKVISSSSLGLRSPVGLSF